MVVDQNRPTYFLMDVTGSMHEHLADIWSRLKSATALMASAGARWAVIYSDHGNGEPFVVRTVGPCSSIAELAIQVATLPLGNGGDREEALEDAVRTCRQLVAKHGPGDVVVVTDAPPHPPQDCPNGYDFERELLYLLAEGCTCAVANDWQDPTDVTWQMFEGLAAFRRDALEALWPDRPRAG